MGQVVMVGANLSRNPCQVFVFSSDQDHCGLCWHMEQRIIIARKVFPSPRDYVTSNKFLYKTLGTNNETLKLSNRPCTTLPWISLNHPARIV